MDKKETFQFTRTHSAKKSAAVLKSSHLPQKCLRMLRPAAPSSLAKRPPGQQAEEAAIERAVDALETEAVRRALSGVSVPVFHQGRECGSTVKHSDQLLMFLLKTLKPDRYGGGKESAQPQNRLFALDIELPRQNEGVADEEPEGPDEDEGRQEAGGGCALWE